MHFARPSIQQSQIGNVITRVGGCPKKIGASSATWQPAPLVSSLPSPNLFLSLDRPEAVCRGVTTDTAQRCSGAHFRRSQGSSVSGSAPPSTLPIRPIPCLSSLSRQVSCTRCWESSRGLGYPAQRCIRLRFTCNPHLVREIFSIGFANLI